MEEEAETGEPHLLVLMLQLPPNQWNPKFW